MLTGTLLAVTLFCGPAAAQNGQWNGQAPANSGHWFNSQWTGDCHNDQPQYNRNVLTVSASDNLTSGDGTGWTLLAEVFGSNKLTSCLSGQQSAPYTCSDWEILNGDKFAGATLRWLTTSVGLVSYLIYNEVYPNGEVDSGSSLVGGPGSPYPLVFSVTCPVIQTCTQNCSSSPIIIPLGDRVDIRFSTAADGVNFDIDGSGVPKRVAWPVDPSKVAWLAWDRDGDGQITSGKELVGDHTFDDLDNGFAALVRIVGGVGESIDWVDSGQPTFDRLLLWTDRNRDGISQPDELQPASNVLLAIKTFANQIGKRDQNGNTYRLQGEARYKDHPNGVKPIYDMYLATQ